VIPPVVPPAVTPRTPAESTGTPTIPVPAPFDLPFTGERPFPGQGNNPQIPIPPFFESKDIPLDEDVKKRQYGGGFGGFPGGGFPMGGGAPGGGGGWGGGGNGGWGLGLLNLAGSAWGPPQSQPSSWAGQTAPSWNGEAAQSTPTSQFGGSHWRLEVGSETKVTNNQVAHWWTMDGRSARVDAGFTSREDGSVVPNAETIVTTAEYIGALPKKAAIAVIVSCVVVGLILLALVVVFIVKKRRPAYVEETI
jgi:hypothetical protein